MPRNRLRKTQIGLHSHDLMEEAVNLVKNGKTIRGVSQLKNIPYATLYRYCKKSERAEGPVRLTPNYSVNRLFTDEEEKSLEEYIIKSSQMFYGLTNVDVRRLAYEMAVANNTKIPDKWHQFQMAGIEWLYNFRKRHSILSLRTPEGCSLSRATSFNRHNVNIFFDNLQEVMQRSTRFGDGTRVFNLDETNTMTVQKSGKVLAVRGQKQVSKVTSGEKGTLVTTCYMISATGQALPPVMIFPRVHFKNHMIDGAPAGTLGLAAQSGWMNSDLFVPTLKHFIDQTQSSIENPSLLIMDNFEAHICLRAITMAKENGVTILTVPPHSTGKLQPLDVGVFGPFKIAYNSAVDSWMMRNPGKTFSIYEVAKCVKEAHMRAMTPANICSAFAATGIFPYNRHIFTEIDFAPSEVTDRIMETEHPEFERQSTISPSPSILQEIDEPEDFQCVFASINSEGEVQQQQDPSESIPRQNDTIVHALSSPPIIIEDISDNTKQFLQMQRETLRTPSPNIESPKASTSFVVQPKTFKSPFELRGLPKAKARKTNRAARKKGKSMVATDTPNKNEIEERELIKDMKKQAAKNKKRKVLQNDSRNKKVMNRKEELLLSDTDEENECMSIYSEDEGSDEEEPELYVIDPKHFSPLDKTPTEGQFVLVQFKINNKQIFYVAKVLKETQADEVEVSFLRKCQKTINQFRLPNIPDLAAVPYCDLMMLLPLPSYSGTTKRQQGFYTFANIDFSRIDIR